MAGTDKSQTLADWIMLLGGAGGGDRIPDLTLEMLEGLGLIESLDISVGVGGGLLLLASWALMASWYLLYLS